ncbi:MAG: hypothetical protein LUD27_06620 [Clostridia bacterium]|nr:hypothetical protein [Clostridia bacterium]
MGVIIYNGKSSKDFGLEVWQAPEYQIPERDYETVHIEGRSGDLVIDRGSFKNVTRSYTISFGKDKEKYFTPVAKKVAEWLHSSTGYARLEDSYEPEYYRQAIVYKSLSITNLYEKAGYLTIEFYCKPQRFLKAGEKVITVESGTTKSIHNPTVFASRPIIKIYGSGFGTVTINDKTVTINSIDGYLTIDCELMEVYKDDDNCNSKIILDGNEFPKLTEGTNSISFSGSITSLEVTPKWWTI